MTTLYDVFKAIQADEGDHVTAMEACLDPDMAVVSPSIEMRFLTGAALAAVVTLLGTSVGSPSGFEDLPGNDIVEGLAASGAAITSRILEVRTLTDAGTSIEEAVEGAGLLAETVTLEKALTGAIGAIAAGVVGLSSLVRSDEIHGKQDLSNEARLEEDDD
jgi:hypothetical protein